MRDAVRRGRARRAASTSAIVDDGTIDDRARRDRATSRDRRGDRRRASRRAAGEAGAAIASPATSSAAGRCRRRLARTTAVPDASGVQRASLRDGDDALHPQPRAEGHRPRHVDDPARLVHDEAERRGRDAAGHAGRSSRACIRSRRSSRRPGYAADLHASSSTRSCADHRLRRRCRCSRTPARRASSPACW